MSSTSPPRRRILPQPVESTIRTSKRLHSETSDEVPSVESVDSAEPPKMSAASKPKRFLPQPVEETARTSRKKNAEHVEHTAISGQGGKSLAPAFGDDPTLPAAATTKKPGESVRRFAPEPVETTNRSSRRKFAPEPVETTTRSSKNKADQERDTSPSSRPRRKFAPEPVETTTVRRRRKTEDDMSSNSPSDSASDTSSLSPSRRSTGGRKFSPELIETATGRFRQGKKESGSSVKKTLRPSPVEKAHESEQPETESRFSAANLGKRHHEERRHSYCVPNLPSIESDSSEEESVSSQAGSPSDTDHEMHQLDKISERGSTSFTDYVLSLSDRQKLQEQAMAAYINEVPREQVNHFAVEEDSEDESTGVLSANEGADPGTFRRSSQDELVLEMESMRRHHEQLEKAKRELAEDTAGASRFSAAALAARHHLNLAKKPKPKKEVDEYTKMRAAASPPMLGDDLVFPYTVSPRLTRCDVDQAPRPRCADSDDEEEETQGDPALWSAQIGVSNRHNAGLWMGLCQQGDESSRPGTPIKSGIQTPAVESSNPFESMTPGRGTRTPGRKHARPHNGMGLMPITPPRSADGRDPFIDSIDRKLERERQMEEEFPNSVITQIYNYLSLGYPSLARDFDEELSKISRISVEELRKDDRTALENVKGYVGAPEAEGNWEEDEQGAVKGCRRWEALRLYVREWARQSPTFVTERPPAQNFAYKNNSIRTEAWSAAGRRGSWAQ